MATRRIVTEEVDGRSRVRSDEKVVGSSFSYELWAATPEDPMGFDPGPDGTGIVVPPNHSWFRIAHLPPHAEMQAMLAQVSSGDIDADGFHTTNSIDYVLVLDGPVELLLDDGSVIVEPGDCVVQRGTNHAWRNHGDKPIRLIAVLIGTP